MKDDILTSPMYYDLRGRPITAKEWAKAMKTDRHIGDTKLWFGRLRISTVWLGLDHGFKPGGKPVIFETMVFNGDDSLEQERYSTIDEALAGHVKYIKKYKVWRTAVKNFVREVE